MKNELVRVKNPNVILLQVYHDKKIVDLNIKKDSYPNIKVDTELQDILSRYRGKKYKIYTFVSGTESPEEVLGNILSYEINKLFKANVRD